MFQTQYGLVDAINREREVSPSLENSFNNFADSPLIQELLNSVPSIYMILNESHEIVFANQSLTDIASANTQKQVIGLRAGEALRCFNARNHDSDHADIVCQSCGLQNALARSRLGRTAETEGFILKENGEALDLRIRAKPLYYEGSAYSLVSLADISHEKRRYALERIFFQDVLNTATNVQGFGQLLQEMCSDADEDMACIIKDMSTQLVENIQAQQVISSAEKGELTVNLQSVNSLVILKELAALYRHHEAALDRQLAIDPVSTAIEFDSDAKLVRHVFGHMILNALEATQPGETVTIACRKLESDRIEFSVHNPQSMPSQVQMRIFHRSFSTKGPGRGLGLYSMKMLTERYLQGKLSFSSSPESGTTFTVRFPRRMMPTWVVAR